MKDVVYGTTTPFSLDGMIDRISFICTAYDPGPRRYRFDYSLMFGGVLAGFSLLAMGGLSSCGNGLRLGAEHERPGAE